VDTFGYKDFIPMFTVPKFDPDEWAELFEKSGVKYVIPTAEHHDWFSLWDSDVTRWCAGKMGPKRDLIGELGKAIRARGMKFGVSNHSIEHYTFIQPLAGVKTDLGDPAYVDFYWVTNHNDANLQKFLELWLAKNVELIDKYQPDMLWFDNGINHRMYDPLKLKVAAYYYNRARQWGKEVSISTKDRAYLAGSILDFERQGARRQLPSDTYVGKSLQYDRYHC
jgi:alpha-L-fucosidase